MGPPENAKRSQLVIGEEPYIVSPCDECKGKLHGKAVSTFKQGSKEGDCQSVLGLERSVGLLQGPQKSISKEAGDLAVLKCQAMSTMSLGVGMCNYSTSC